VKVNIINQSAHPLPAYETQGAAGMDIRANLTEDVVLHPLDRKLIPTGLFIALPLGFEAQLRPRSGMAFKHGITLPNSPATIDSDYRGEIKVAVINLSKETYTIKNGERIAQMVVARHETVQWEIVETLDETHRGESGFGSTGKK